MTIGLNFKLKSYTINKFNKNFIIKLNILTFENTTVWLYEFINNCDDSNTKIILLGNKK